MESAIAHPGDNSHSNLCRQNLTFPEKDASVNGGKEPVVKAHGSLSRWERASTTACLYGAFICFGLTVGCYGPALMDLRHIAGVNIGDIVLMLTSKRAGALLGSLLGGAIYDKWNRHIPIILAVSVIGLTSIGIPWCSMIILMIVLATLQGIANGMLETCSNALILHIWGKDSKPYLQGLHFTFAVGAFVSPLIMEPFLGERHVLPKYPVNNTDNMTIHIVPVSNTTNASQYDDAFFVTSPSTQQSTYLKNTSIQYGFLIYGILSILVGLFFLAIMLHKKISTKRNLRKMSMEVEEKQALQEGSPNAPTREKRALRYSAVGASCIFQFFDFSIQDGFTGLVATFVVSYLHWTVEAGSQVTSVYFGGYGLGRLLAIPISKVVHPRKMLAVLLLLLATSSVGITLGLGWNEVVFWVFVGTLGAAQGPLLPTNLLCLDHVVEVMGKTSGLLLVIGSIGGMVIPVILGQSFQDGNAMVFPYFLCAASAALCVIYVAMTIIYRQFKGSRHSK